MLPTNFDRSLEFGIVLSKNRWWDDLPFGKTVLRTWYSNVPSPSPPHLQPPSPSHAAEKPEEEKNATDQSIGVGRRVGGPVQKIWKVKGDAANAAEIKISDSLCKLDLKSNHI